MGKGADFEREISRVLSLWWTDGKRDDIFYRTQASGARFTSRNKAKKETAFQAGDITFSDPIGKPLIDCWCIEDKTGYSKKDKLRNADGSPVVKSVKTKGGTKEICVERMVRWDVLDFLDSRQKEPMLAQFWGQCCRDANIAGRNPVLIFRRSGRAACIAFEYPYFCRLLAVFGGPQGNYIKVWANNIQAVMIMSLSDFFDWIPDFRPFLEIDNA